jgi:hypothetical protein
MKQTVHLEQAEQISSYHGDVLYMCHLNLLRLKLNKTFTGSFQRKSKSRKCTHKCSLTFA